MENESNKEDLDKWYDINSPPNAFKNEEEIIKINIKNPTRTIHKYTLDNPFQKEWNDFNNQEMFNIANIALRPYGWVLIKIVDRDDYKGEQVLGVYPMKLGE